VTLTFASWNQIHHGWLRRLEGLRGAAYPRDGHYDVRYRPTLVGVTFEPWRPGLPIR
jgi:hypothetical protein